LVLFEFQEERELTYNRLKQQIR